MPRLAGWKGHLEREMPHQPLAILSILAQLPDMLVKKTSDDSSPRPQLNETAWDKRTTRLSPLNPQTCKEVITNCCSLLSSIGLVCKATIDNQSRAVRLYLDLGTPAMLPCLPQREKCLKYRRRQWKRFAGNIPKSRHTVTLAHSSPFSLLQQLEEWADLTHRVQTCGHSRGEGVGEVSWEVRFDIRTLSCVK